MQGESVVAVFLPRTNERVYAAQLAAMKAGAAHLCIDHMIPDERIKFMLADATPSAIVTDQASYPRLRRCMVECDVPVIVYEDWENDDTTKDGGDVSGLEIDESRLAYIIYTSGSTGQPKGVLVEHRNISNLIRSNLSYYADTIGPYTRFAQSTSLAFDTSVETIYFGFAFGGTIIVVDDEVIRSGPDLPFWLSKVHINLFFSTPSHLRTMGAEASRILKEVKLVYAVGEELTSDVAEIWSNDRLLING